MKIDLSNVKKIAIVGGPGTGKTTLSNKLSEILNLPIIHIDGIHYLSNWKIRDEGERDKIILSYINTDKWIIDGTYKSTLIPRFENADMIIWLDYSSFVQIKGILKRYIINKNHEKSEIPGCKEQINKEFFLYTLNYRKNKRHYIEDAIEKIDNTKVVRFKKQRELNKWIKKVEK